MMKSVARRVALNLSEAKRYTTLNEIPFGVPPVTARSFAWTYKNVFAPIPSANGSAAGSSWAIDGNEIVDPMVTLKSTWILNYQNILYNELPQTYGSTYMWIYLIACNEQVSGTVPPSNTWTTYPAQYSSGDFGWFLTQNATRPTLNGNNVKVIRRWGRKYTPDEQFAAIESPTNVEFYTAGRPSINIQCKHRFRGKKTFEDAPFGDTDSNFLRSVMLRGWNFYWLMGWGNGTGLTLAAANQPSVTADTYTYFKDP